MPSSWVGPSLLVVAALGATASARAAEPWKPRRVIALYQDELSLPANGALSGGVRAALALSGDVELHTEHLDRTRFPEPSYRLAVRAWLGTKYAGAPPDVVLAIGEDSVSFLADRSTMPWPRVPVVFGLVDERSAVLEGLPPGFTGVADRLQVRETIELARRLLPDSRRVVLIGGTSHRDQQLASLLRREAAPFSDRLEIVDLVGLPAPELLERARALPRGSFLLGLSYIVDGAGRPWTGPQIARALAASGAPPVFAPFAHLVGHGTIGGVAVDYEETGRRLAQLAMRILDGEPVAALPIQKGGPYRVVLDGRELNRWRIPDALVPVGAAVLFREPSALRRYRWELAAFLTALALETALITGLLVERRGRRTAEARARENLAVVAHMNRVSAIGELAGSFAHELNSPLGAVLNNAQAARRFLARGTEDPSDVLACLDDIVGDARRAGEVVRRMRGVMKREDLRPVPVDVAAVIRDALRLVEAEARDREVVLAAEVPVGMPPVSGDDVQLVQVVLNLVMNALDALAQAPRDHRRVEVGAVALPDGVEIRVSDNGPGVPPAQAERIFDPFFTTKSGGLGLGLAITRSVVEAHGGHIRVASAPEGGAVFRVFLPTPKAHPEAAAVPRVEEAPG